MPKRELLSPAQRAELTAFPDLDERSLIKHYTLTRSDLEFVRTRRGGSNQFGFAIELLILNHLGWSHDESIKPSEQVIHFVAEQLHLHPALFKRYATRTQTRSEHFSELQRYFGFRAFTPTRKQELREFLLPIALSTTRGLALITAALEELRVRKILLPGLVTLEHLASDLLLEAERETFKQLTLGLKAELRTRLDALLKPEDGRTISRFAWLRQTAGKSSKKSFAGLLERLEFIRALGLDADVTRTVHQNRLKHLALEGSKLAAHHVNDFEPARRHATLVATLLDRMATLTDAALEMFDRMVGKTFQRATLAQNELQLKHGKAINEKVLLYERIGRALIQARDEKTDPFLQIEKILPWTQFVESVGEAKRLAQPEPFDAMHLLKASSEGLRAISYPLFDGFVFSAAPVAEDTLKAIALLRDLKARGKRNLPEDAPVSFVKAKWKPHVMPTGSRTQLDRTYYELCVLNELQGHLRSGDVWVAGSRKYRDFETYLLPQANWTTMLEQARTGLKPLPLAIGHSFNTHWDQRSLFLESELDVVHDLLERGELPDVRLEADELVFTPLTKAVPDAAKALSDKLYSLMPRIKITELLLEVDARVGFLRAFTHLQSGLVCDDAESLLAVILADGINLGLTKMADATPGMTQRRLGWVADWFVREDTYGAALAELTNFQNKLPLAQFWGDGTTSSSDGQQFKTGSHGNRHGQVNARYGNTPGVTFYTHVSDQYSPFHTRVISTSKRDATYVLDGLLYHESDLNILEHYTDTHGYTEHVFALFPFMGFKYAPRIRNLTDSRLFLPDGFSSYPKLTSLIGGTLDRKHLEANWDDVLRLASSIKLGTVTASLMLAKLSAYPRQNGLAVALRELGRLERTVFTLEWLQSPELRRRVLKGLNKGESRNALADAVFFNRRGELRDRTVESQAHRASGLNLLTACIAVWNTIYLERTVGLLRARGEVVLDEVLEHVAPLGWEHVGLTGDYVWRSDGVPGRGEFRVLNDKKSS